MDNTGYMSSGEELLTTICMAVGLLWWVPLLAWGLAAHFIW